MEENEKNGLDKGYVMQDKIRECVTSMYDTFPDMDFNDLVTMATLFNTHVGVMVSMCGMRNGERVNVRTVLEDICSLTMSNLDSLIEDNPYMADDYVWPEEDKEE